MAVDDVLVLHLIERSVLSTAIQANLDQSAEERERREFLFDRSDRLHEWSTFRRLDSSRRGVLLASSVMSPVQFITILLTHCSTD